MASMAKVAHHHPRPNGFPMALSASILVPLEGRMDGPCEGLPNLACAGAKNYYLQDHFAKST